MQPFYPEGHRTSPLDLPPIPTPTFNRSNRFNINAGFSQSSTCDQLPNRPDHGAVQITAQFRSQHSPERSPRQNAELTTGQSLLSRLTRRCGQRVPTPAFVPSPASGQHATIRFMVNTPFAIPTILIQCYPAHNVRATREKTCLSLRPHRK
jgi:hypothetical protein